MANGLIASSPAPIRAARSESSSRPAHHVAGTAAAPAITAGARISSAESLRRTSGHSTSSYVRPVGLEPEQPEHVGERTLRQRNRVRLVGPDVLVVQRQQTKEKGEGREARDQRYRAYASASSGSLSASCSASSTITLHCFQVASSCIFPSIM